MGSVVVVEGKNPIGIITERDILRQILKGALVLQKPVKRAMSKPLITGSPDMTVQETIALMLKNNIRRLPIFDGSKLVGIVTDKDLMRSILLASYEKLTKPHLRRRGIEAARIAARIATLLNL